MANSFYSYLAFIHPDSDADIDTLKSKLTDFYALQDNSHQPEIILNGNTLSISFSDGYTFYITSVKGNVVNEEAIEMAETQKVDVGEEPFDAQKLKKCHQRFEMHGDQDFGMDYFNDSIFILEQLEDFKEIFIFDVSGS